MNNAETNRSPEVHRDTPDSPGDRASMQDPQPRGLACADGQEPENKPGDQHRSAENHRPPQTGPSAEQGAAEEKRRLDREIADAMAEMAPADMAELSGDVTSDGRVAQGTELVGTVVGISDDDVFLEFGPKSQGVLPRTQFGKKEPVEIGRRVDVVVEKVDPDSGLIQVNRKGAIQRATWTNLAVGNLVEGRATGLIKGGLEIDLKGIRAFMPGSQADIHPMKDISVLLNQNIKCEVIELNRKHKNVIVSRRKVLEREMEQQREQLKAELQEGQLRKGIVRRITEFGAFVDLGGIDGLLHIRDISWGTVDKVTDVLSVDQEIEVMVLKIDKKKDRISLGLKQALPDPWQGVAERYPVNEKVKARVVRLADFGAFAEVEPGIEGLIPISEMSWGRIRNVSEAVSAGDVVDCVIIRAEPEKRRIALSMKQAQADPWAGVLEGYTPQSLVKGKVTRLTDFGAFVELTPGVEGLIHISELSDKHVKSCSEVVRVGEEVETRVLGVNPENRRISLSIKAVHAPTGDGEAAIEHADNQRHQKQKTRKRPLRGGLASHFEW
jgi:small subunit ribosomal protein S1